LEGGADRLVLAALRDRAQRVVYLSTTSVYGDTFQVDEHTSPSPRTPSERDRLATEQAVSDGPWSSLILRPAAIYGPGRGVHVAMREGRHKLMGDGSNFISRIHVEDLAAIAEASLPSELEGAYPVADEHPCPAREIAEFCSTLLSVPMPPPAPLENIPATLRTNRRVDGSAIRRALNITLQYPSYREGIPAAIAVERTR
jgi:nucleoside-diphosphate-sugar epimerase